MAEEIKFRPLNQNESIWIMGKRFYAEIVLNRFLESRMDAGALDVGSATQAGNLAHKIRKVIKSHGLARYLGCSSRGESIIIWRATEEEIPPFKMPDISGAGTKRNGG